MMAAVRYSGVGLREHYVLYGSNLNISAGSSDHGRFIFVLFSVYTCISVCFVRFFHFHRDASAVYAVVVCPSVRLSHTSIVPKRL